MKSSLSLSPSSSSYSSTADFNDGICNSKSVPSGCLTGVFRRFLCFVNVSQRPFDHIKEIQNELISGDTLCHTNAEENADESGKMGIVARLMGLDSMPRVDSSNTRKNSNSVTRSRSMNSAETWTEFEPKQGKHRRVKSSTLSFPEDSSLLELENDKFFVLSFKNGGEIEEFGSELKKSNMGFGELRQRKTERRRNKSKKREKVSLHEMNKENEETNKNPQVVWGDGKFEPIKDSQENSRTAGQIVRQSKHMQPKSRTERGKLRKNRKENCSPIKKLETECDSENSSPVSVLDYVQLPVNTKVHHSEKDSRLTGLNSRRKLSEKLENHEQFSCSNTKSSILDSEEKRIEGKLNGLMWKEGKNDSNYEELWGEICKLAEKDMMQCTCMFKGKYKIEEFEEICLDFGLKIVDQLLFELVDQLIFL